MSLPQVLGMLKRHKWLLLFFVLAGASVASYRIYNAPDRYMAAASMRIVYDRRALTAGISEDVAVESNIGRGGPAVTQLELVRSDAVLGQVVDRLGLQLRSVGGAPGRHVLDQISVDSDAKPRLLDLTFQRDEYVVRDSAGTFREAYGQPVDLGDVTFALTERPSAETGQLRVMPRTAAVAMVRGSLQATPRERTADLVDLRVLASDPVAAREIVNAVARSFEEFSVELAQQQSRRRRLFIEEQLAKADSAVAEAQQALTSYRSSEEGFGSVGQALSAQQNQLAELESRRRTLSNERQIAQRLLEDIESHEQGSLSERIRGLVSAPGIASNRMITNLFSELVNYESERAALTSGSFALAPTHPDVERLDALIRTTERNLAQSVESHLATLDAEISVLDSMRNENTAQIRRLPGREAEEARLEQRLETARLLANQLLAEHQRARIAEMVQAGQVEVLDLASGAFPLPTPVTSELLLWISLGLLLGGGGAFVWESANTSIRRPREIEDTLHVPELAAVPALPWPNGGRRRGSAREERIFSDVQAYRILRTNLTMAQGTGPLKTVMITSAEPGEGKSMTALNLAAAFADRGDQVLLIDADLRRPNLHRAFDIPRAPGLRQLLVGEQLDIAALIRPTGRDRLHLLPAGKPCERDPADLLSGDKAAMIIESVRNGFDRVVIDTPPLGAVPDAAILSNHVDGTVLVVRAGKTELVRAQNAITQLTRVGARVLGAVFNDPDEQLPRYGGKKYYSYAYEDYGYGPTS